VTESPRIRAFEAAAQTDVGAATAALRADLEAAQGPLFEPIEGDDERVLATFVWIGSDGPLTMYSQAIPQEGVSAVPAHAMQRIEGTDVWTISASVRRDARTTYSFVVDDPVVRSGEEDLLGNLDRLFELRKEAKERTFGDPFNPNRLPTTVEPGGDELRPERHWTSLFAGPAAPEIPWYGEPRERGLLADHTLASAAFGNARRVVVYTPPGYDAGAEPYPLLVLFDGELWLTSGQVNLALDNLIEAGRIPPLVAAFSFNATPTSRMGELPCNDDLPRMLEELLALVDEHYTVTDDRARRVLGGASYGGLASAWVGFARPDLFRNLMCSSSSFWWGLATPGQKYSFGRDGEPEWLTRQYAGADVKPLRFWIDVGALEGGPILQAPHVDHVGANRHFRTVLQARGYDDVTYVETPGGHDIGIWRWTFAESLPILLGG
jgi:enterochelin esterase family protein